MLDDFLFRAFVAGCALAVAAGPLGCFVVWRRMAYFGDATAHAALLGVAISIAMSMSVFIGVLLVTILMAVAIAHLHGKRYELDTLLGVVAHLALATGLVVVATFTDVRIDINAYLFGDILAITRAEVLVIWLGALVTLGLLVWRWVPLLSATLSEDLACADGHDVGREQLFLMICLAILVAVAIKLVGALLITAMLIIPAAAARPFARTPELMAVLAIAAGIASVVGGLGLSVYADTPSGPSIVVVAGILFLFSNGLMLRR